MKVIITQRLDGTFRVAIRNGAGKEIEVDDEAHTGIRQEAEADMRAKVLSVPNGWQVINEDAAVNA